VKYECHQHAAVTADASVDYYLWCTYHQLHHN